MGATITVGGLALFAEGMRNPLIHRKKRKKITAQSSQN